MANGRMRVFTYGVEFLDVQDPSERSRVGEYWNALRHYLATGDDGPLSSFEGETVEGRRLVTNLDLIDEEARRGELDFPDIYE